MARYSFSGSVPPKFEQKLRHHKQGFGKIATIVPLNNERLSLVKTKLPIKNLANCNPYFTALQYINNLETQRSPKTTVNPLNLENLIFFKKIYQAV